MRFKNLYSKPLFVNITSLGLLQIANYALPVLVIPFITRALGADFFGKASYAQNIIAYLTIIINYGFEYSATQDIALHRNDKSKLKTIFWTVTRFKSQLLIISFFILGILYFTFSKVNEDPLLYFYAALINIGFVMFPTWFFQGIEKMKDMAIFNFIIKLSGAILVIWMINTPAGYRNYILILSLSYVLVGIISFVYVIKKYDLGFRYEKDKDLSNKVIRKGAPIFLNNVFVSLYTITGMTIAGIYLPNKDIGLYAITYKIIMAVVMLISMPINTALFPLMSKKFKESVDEGFYFLKKTTTYLLIFGIIIGIFVFITSPYIIQIFWENKSEEAISLLRLFSPLPCLVTIASLLTVQGLYGLQMQKYAPFVGASIGICSIMLALMLIPAIGVKGAIITCLIAVALEILIVLFLLGASKKLTSLKQ